MVDVLHVEDRDYAREYLQLLIEAEGLSYCGSSTLSDFVHLMKEDPARVYVLDGCFPVRHQEEPRFLADRACKEVRRLHPDAKIILYSDMPELSDLAQTLNIVGMSKSVHSEQDVVKRVIELMDL